METTFKKYWNCTELKIKIKNFTLSFIKIYKDIDKNAGNFTFRINRYENGNAEIYLNLFKRYTIEMYGITLKPGKRKYYKIF